MEADLQRLLRQGVIEPVQFSDWATPIVPVVKGDESVCICGDYRITINQQRGQDRHLPPPTH